MLALVLVLACALCPAAAGCLNDQQRAWLHISYAEMTFGIADILGCLCVLAVILAYNRDRRDLRNRILVGMFASNLVYSLYFVIPTTWPDVSGPTIGHGQDAQCELIVSMPAFATAAGFMVSGKFMMVAYELFIVAASVVALRTGATELGKWTERACHGVCVGIGLAVFIAWVAVQAPRAVSWGRSWKASRTADTAGQAETDSANADANADAWDATYAAYLQAWVGFLAVVVVLWVYQRFVLLRRRTADWDASLAGAAGQWDRDLWKKDDPWTQQQRAKKRRLLDTYKEGFNEVAKPLAPYITVFLLFSPPAVLLATDWCQADQDKADLCACRAGCDVISTAVLSLRPLFTVAVYFSNSERRAELLAFGKLRRKVWLRLRASVLWCAGAATGRADLATVGAGGGYRARFGAVPDQVHEFERDAPLSCDAAGANDAAAKEEHEAGEDAGGTGISYQLMED